MTPDGRSEGVLVSVVVPVYNAGAYLERCAPSLTGQSLGPDRYEVIYVDDGSTDGSGERLDALAARHHHVRVHHQENSGWPGAPRNVGIDLARGRYVQFVDQDDELAPEALERLVDLAERSKADIVLGMLAGTMMGPRRIYRRTLEGMGVVESRAADSLTGHKMFRRDFLDEHQIRFPEGYWRMEDLLFVVRAYAHDPVVSVLADYPCYFWNRREDGGNNSTAAFDFAGHFERLGVIIRAAGTASSPAVRDALLRRLYRVELLNYVSGATLLGDDVARSREAHAFCQETARTVMPPDVRTALSGVQSVRAAVLELGSWDQMRRVTSHADEIRPRITASRVRWDGQRLRLHVRAVWLWRGKRLTLTRDADDCYHLPPEFLDGLPEGADVPIADPLADASADVSVHDPAEPVWWWASSDVRPVLEEVALGRFATALEGDVVLHPGTVAGGRPLTPGDVELSFAGQMLGVGRSRRLRPARVPPSRVVIPGSEPAGATVARAVRAPEGRHLQLQVRPARETLLREITERQEPRRAGPARSGRPLGLDVSMPRLRLPREGLTLSEGDVRTRLVPTGDGPRLEIEQSTSLGWGVHRVATDAGTLGRVLVVAGRVRFFIGNGWSPRGVGRLKGAKRGTS